MAVTVVQSKGGGDSSGSATSFALTFDSPVTAGNKILCFMNLYNNGRSVTGVSSTGATWTEAVAQEYTTFDWLWAVYEAPNVSGGSGYQVTASFSGGLYVGMVIMEVSGAGNTIASDIAMPVSASGSVSGAALSPSGSGLHLAAMGHNGYGPTISPGTGWTQVIEFDEVNDYGTLAIESRAAANGVSQTPTWNISADGSNCSIAHIVLADAAGGQPLVKRYGGVPFMRRGGTTFGQGWG